MYSPTETFRALMNPANGAATTTSANAFSARASCACASASEARAVATFCIGRFRLGPGLIRHFMGQVARCEEPLVSLGRRLRQPVLGFRQFHGGLRSNLGDLGFIEPQSRINAPQPHEHRALAHVLAYVLRGRHDAAGRFRRDVGILVSDEAARRLERDGLVLADDNRGPHLHGRRRLRPGGVEGRLTPTAGLSDNEDAQRQKWRERNLHTGHRGQLKDDAGLNE